jgi:hypothetical protein
MSVALFSHSGKELSFPNFNSFSADLNNVERSKRVGIDPNRGTGSTSVNLNCRIAGPPDRTIEIWECNSNSNSNNT